MIVSCLEICVEKENQILCKLRMGRSPAEPTAEAGAGDEAAPDEGGAEEARRWVARRQAEDLLDELVHQLRRPRRHAACSDLMCFCCQVGPGGRHGYIPLTEIQ